jgi:hypothetical protein
MELGFGRGQRLMVAAIRPIAITITSPVSPAKSLIPINLTKPTNPLRDREKAVNPPVAKALIELLLNPKEVTPS